MKIFRSIYFLNIVLLLCRLPPCTKADRAKLVSVSLAIIRQAWWCLWGPHFVHELALLPVLLQPVAQKQVSHCQRTRKSTNPSCLLLLKRHEAARLLLFIVASIHADRTAKDFPFTSKSSSSRTLKAPEDSSLWSCRISVTPAREATVHPHQKGEPKFKTKSRSWRSFQGLNTCCF